MRIASRRDGVDCTGSFTYTDRFREKIEPNYTVIGTRPALGQDVFIYDNKTMDRGIEIPDSPERDEKLYERLTKEQYKDVIV